MKREEIKPECEDCRWLGRLFGCPDVCLCCNPYVDEEYEPYYEGDCPQWEEIEDD